MAGSTYSSNLKIELMSTGENAGTWGNITNTNLGTALEQAVVGLGNPDFVADANLTITITNSNAAQAARALVLNVTSAFGSLSATRELVVPTSQKQYIVQNNTAGGQSITVKTSGGTGITVPNGRKAHLYVDGTNVVQMFDFVDINGGAIDGTTVGAAAASTGAFTNLSASGTLGVTGVATLGVGAVLNTPASVTLTNATGLPISTGVSGLGTGVATFLGTPSSANLAAAVTDETGTGALVFANSPTLVTPALGTPASGVVTNLTGTASININGTVGATTPATGSFTNITGSANAVISVTDNTNAALRITQLGTGNALLVEDSTNPDSTPFVIDSTGDVIRGNLTALSGYSYVGLTGRTPSVQFIGSSSDDSIVSATNIADGFASSGILLTAKARGTIASPTAVISTDRLGTWSIDGYDGASFITAAEIFAVVDGTPGTNDMPGRLVFSTTADGASSPTERMRIDSAGGVGIGGGAGAGDSVRVIKNMTGSTATTGVFNRGVIQSDVTSSAVYFQTSTVTQASAFTLPTLKHYSASQGTIGVGSTVTSQFGYSAESNLTGATNNYGFYGNIASGTGRYNFYAAGTANNYFAGNVGIATTAPAYRLDVTATDNVTTTIAVAVENSARSYGVGIGAYTMSNRGIGAGATNIDYTFDIGGASIFKTADTERMRITSDGNVGIGTSSPGAPLNVRKDGAGDIEIARFANHNTDEHYLVLKVNDDSNLVTYESTGASSGGHVFKTGNTERMRIDSAGNVGIGTSSPTSFGSGFAVAQVNGSSGGYVLVSQAGTTSIGEFGTDSSVVYVGSRSTNTPIVFRQNGGTERARIDSSGNLLVGTTSGLLNERIRADFAAGNTGITVSVASTATQSHIAFYNGSVVGTISTNGSATTYATSSDYRLKNITGPITNSGAYIDSLNPVEGTWKADGSTFVGLIAHEAQEASRTPVATGVKDGEQMQGMDYSSAEIIANLIAEVKALRVRVAQLEAS